MEGGALLTHSIITISCKSNPSHLSRSIPIQRPRLLQKPCTTTTTTTLMTLRNKRVRVQTWIRSRRDPIPETGSGLGDESKREDGSEKENEELVEELECLEKEAIAGEDEGRAPTDYDRRAHIFDESSKVFRALKDDAAAAAAAGEGRQDDDDEHV